MTESVWKIKFTVKNLTQYILAGKCEFISVGDVTKDHNAFIMLHWQTEWIWQEQLSNDQTAAQKTEPYCLEDSFKISATFSRKNELLNFWGTYFVMVSHFSSLLVYFAWFQVSFAAEIDYVSRSVYVNCFPFIYISADVSHRTSL